MKKRENYGSRMVRIIFEAGYSVKDIPNLTINEILEIKGITVPNIKTIIYIQNKIRGTNKNKYQYDRCYRNQHKCNKK